VQGIKRIMTRGLLVMLAFALVGCVRSCGGKSHRDMTPEQVVEAYLDVALNMTDVSQRADLLEYTTGRLREAIESVSEDTIRAAYIDRKYKIKRYSVVQRDDRTPRETEITFQLEYNDLGTAGGKVDESPLVKTENRVSVIREKGFWLIRDVVGNKTAIDFPVSADSRIEARPGEMTTTTPEDEAPAPEGEAAPATP
jgi:hypothetical protein